MVTTHNNHSASHNGSLSDGDPETVGRGTNNTARRRHRWTTEQRDDLLHVYGQASPQRMGYMVRVQSAWCELHPELDFMTQQNLRDQIAYLRKKQRRSRKRTSRRLSRTAQSPQPPPVSQQPSPVVEHRFTRTSIVRDLKAEFLAELSSLGERKRLRNYKFKVEPQHLDSMNEILKNHLSEFCSLLDINNAVYAAAVVLTPEANFSNKSHKNQRRIQRLEVKVTRCRQDISRIQCVMVALRKGGPYSTNTSRLLREMRAQYHTLNMSTLTLLKQKTVDKLRALSLARKKLVKKVRWSEENSLFLSSPKRLFRPTSKTASNESPNVRVVEDYWRQMYEKESVLEDTPLLAQFEDFCNTHLADPADCPSVTAEEIKRVLSKARNFSAPGVDGVINFWWKSLPVVHPLIARWFSAYIEEEEPIPPWLTEGRTVLIPKTGDLSNPKNYRPITCLNTLYKTFTSVLNERVLSSISPVWSTISEQRGSKRGLAGCKDNLLIDRCVCHDAVYHKRNLSMAWVDYAKAFDTVSHSLILRLLRMLRVNQQIVRCITHLIPLWKTKVAIPAGNKSVSTEWIYYKRGVFQGDSLSPILFCIALLPLSIELRSGKGYMAGPPGRRDHKITHLFYMDDLKLYASNEKELSSALDEVLQYSSAIGMRFGLDKCAVFHVRRGKGMDDGNDVHLVDGNIIQHLDAGESYTFLGIRERGLQDVVQVKQTLRSRYMARLRQIWRSCLSGKNKSAATNVLAVPILSYTFGVLKWNVDELKDLDRKTRKMMNINRSLHPKSSVQRIYLPRQQGGRGLISVECLHNRMTLDIANRVLRSQDPLMQLVRAHEFAGKGAFLFQAARRAAGELGLADLVPDPENACVPLTSVELASTVRRVKKAEQDMLMERHMSKHLHSVFFKHIRENQLSPDLTFSFLRSAGLMSETEGFVLACQDGVINTLAYQSIITQQDVNTSCRLCHRQTETLMHVLSACPSLAASSYLARHNAALRVVYYHLRHAFGIDEHPIIPYVPDDVEEVVENSRCRIYWNYGFPTAKLLSANKPDITLLDFENKQMFVIELSCPAESNISRKEMEKRSKYLDLLSELRKLYPGYSVKLVVLIIGVLGGMRASFRRELEIIPACRPTSSSLVCRVQKAVLLGSMRIVRTLGLV